MFGGGSTRAAHWTAIRSVFSHLLVATVCIVSQEFAGTLQCWLPVLGHDHHSHQPADGRRHGSHCASVAQSSQVLHTQTSHITHKHLTRVSCINRVVRQRAVHAMNVSLDRPVRTDKILNMYLREVSRTMDDDCEDVRIVSYHTFAKLQEQDPPAVAQLLSELKPSVRAAYEAFHAVARSPRNRQQYSTDNPPSAPSPSSSSTSKSPVRRKARRLNTVTNMTRNSYTDETLPLYASSLSLAAKESGV